MNSFGEIRTCLVIMFNVLLIIETRARFIYHADPALHCMQAKIPCSGHSQESCQEYCTVNGFSDGECNGSCCLCFAGMPQRPQLAFSKPTPKVVSVYSSNFPQSPRPSDKPKRQAHNYPHVPNDEDLELEFQNEVSSSSICLTPACVKAANNILVNMDESVRPCDDFYEFACGNFERNTIIPDDKGEVTVIGSLTDKLHQQIRIMLEEQPTKEMSLKEKKSTKLVKNLYQSCSNMAILESQGIKPIDSILKSVGGWPVIEGSKWDSNNKGSWTWINAVFKLKEVGILSGYFFNVGVGPDIKNPGGRIITIAEPSLSFGREQLPNPVFVNAYQKFQVDLAVLLGAKESSAVQEMTAVFNFEKQLVNISLPRELARAHPLTFYNPMKISDLQERFPSVQWLEYIRKSLPASLEIGADEVVILGVPGHLTNLLQLIEKTDNRTLANYIMWRATASVIPFLSESARKVQQDFSARVTGQLVKPPKWQECVGLVTSTLAHAVGSMYVQRYFKHDARAEAIKMFSDIHNAFPSVLNEAKWMDIRTKAKAYDKAKAMRSHTGYPEELLKESSLLKLYDGLELSSNNFFGNVLNITKSATKYSLTKLREPIDSKDWVPRGKPAVINAFYNPLHNSIQFPAGILQGHFFDSDRPHFLNYGAVGWVYGHELIHGFDDQGSRFDLNGDLKDWWDPITKQRYHRKTECIVNQYGRFSFPDLVKNSTVSLNGVISQGENIADNGGIKLAYRGYQTWVQRNGPEKKLPGLKYTPNQLFWISAANNWCSKHRPESIIHTLKSGVHPPGKFRVLGSFSNIDQFSKDFNCPAGAPMNPRDKCTVW